LMAAAKCIDSSSLEVMHSSKGEFVFIKNVNN
jgi:hypothetical protein